MKKEKEKKKDLKKISIPFLPGKLRFNLIEKHVNSIFTGKFVVIFFKAPLQGPTIFRAQIFASAP